ncbi:MAG: tetratricopeptide repeat protein [Bacteroidetes bacterium]|nr:tetratricopeptide repeat protein [Bacteroidota bacterium]
MKPFGIVIIFLFAAFTAFPSVEQLNVAKANKAYSAGSYSIAADLYQKVADAGFASPELFYNLGNTYFKMNDYSRAILWYERARRLDPGNEDINFNLNVANTKISDKIEPLPELFYKRWFNGLIQFLPADTWAMMFICMVVAGLLGLVMYLASRVLVLRKIGFWAALGLFLLSFVSFVFAWNGYNFANSASEAIIFAPTITVKSSPDDKSTDLFVVHEGTKVKLLDNISGWYEIRIANGSVGWLPKNSLEKI